MTKATTVNQQGLQLMQAWVANQRHLKSTNPRHRVLIDVMMESVCPPHPQKVLEVLRTDPSASRLQESDMPRVWEFIQQQQKLPAGGAGGLGIIGQSINWTAARSGLQDNFGLVHFGLLATLQKRQDFRGNRQVIESFCASPEEDHDYLFLGNDLVTVTLDHNEVPIHVWLFTGFSTKNGVAPSLRLSLPGVTDVLYPKCDSLENFKQMQILGQGSFRLAQKFGLLGTDDALADLVIGHDGHTAFFKFNLFLWFFEKFGNEEAALTATKKLCVATIHAPQVGTVPRTRGDMLLSSYPRDQEMVFGRFGLEDWQPTSALFADINMSHRTGVVSSITRIVTEAEDKARKRGFAPGVIQLLPRTYSDRLALFPDTIDVASWLGLHTMQALDSCFPEWREAPEKLSDIQTADSLANNMDFRAKLAEGFDLQERYLMSLLSDHFRMKFNKKIPENAIIFASLRRATAYKIKLVIEFLSRQDIIHEISNRIGRPIFYLFGGIAHQEDPNSIDELEHLLNFIESVNSSGGSFSADFLIGYDYHTAGWLFPGLSKRGCWVGCTNPLSNRSQGTEAFGPSYIKAAVNGLYIMGSDDGGAAELRTLPTVSIYGPATFAGDTSFHNDLWGNHELVKSSHALLANAFCRSLEIIARRIDEDLKRFEKKRGAHAPGLTDKIYAMLAAIARFNGRNLLNTYLSCIER